MSHARSVVAFHTWLKQWWKNPTPINPIAQGNAFDAYMAGWHDGRRDARGK